MFGDQKLDSRSQHSPNFKYFWRQSELGNEVYSSFPSHCKEEGGGWGNLPIGFGPQNLHRQRDHHIA